MSIINFFRNRNIAGKDRYILCIDGGGMRGIVPVLVLQELEKQMRNAGAKKAFQSYFDLIAGTSTGGLIASSLVFPSSAVETIKCSDTRQIDFKALEQMYMTIGDTIFPKGGRIRSLVNVPYQVIGDKYPVSGLENILTEWFENKKLRDAKVPTLLMSYNLTQGKGASFSSYGSSDISVLEACRATSAAPTYFAPIKIKDELYADGGLIANNPSLYAYIEAKNLYPHCKKFHILSLGTAASVHRTEDNETTGLINWIDQVLPIYQTAQKDSVGTILSQMPDVEYVRVEREFNESIKLDDTSKKSMQELNQFGVQLAKDSSEVLKTFASTLVR